MILSESIAKTIVSEINEIIPLKINVMNEKGIIIASSNPSRVNSFHEAAYQIIKDQTSEVRVNYDGEFDGALMGLNYPIKFQDYIVGVIGITGVYDEIKDSSGIIKKMTELLLENTYSVEQKQIRANIYNRYFSDWINQKLEVNEEFVKKGNMLGFDITVDRRLIVCTFVNRETDEIINYLQKTEEVKRAFKERIRRIHPNNLFFEEGHMIVCALVVRNDHEIEAIMEDLIDSLESQYDIQILIGVDSGVFDYRNVKKSFQEAKKANQTCLRKQYNPIVFYNDLHLELFSNELDNCVKQEFINRLFSHSSKKEIKEMMEFLEIYYKCNGSIAEVSKKLFIHKNTTQNRLKVIMERTGFDPRSLKEATLFYIALHFYKEIMLYD